jgi:uncharacterized membrane protein
MSFAQAMILAFLIGIVAGSRALTAPALVAWAAHLNWIILRNSSLSIMGSTASVAVFTALAVGELIGDLLPFAPSRLEAPGLVARFILGGLSGAAVAAAGTQSMTLGAILGAAGGIAGAFAGYKARTGSVRALKVPDFVIALLEDAVAIGAGLFIVTRF